MNNITAALIIDNYNKGTATPKQIALVESWYIRMKVGETLCPRELQKEQKLGEQKLDDYLKSISKTDE